MASESGKTLLAQLPPMRSQDFAEFERTVPIWGQQRAIRRSQLQVIGAATLLGVLAGPLIAKARGDQLVHLEPREFSFFFLSNFETYPQPLYRGFFSVNVRELPSED